MSLKNEGASWDDEKGEIAADPEGLDTPAPQSEDAAFAGLDASPEFEEALKRFGKRASRKRPDGGNCPGGYAYFPQYRGCRRPTVVGKGALLIEESGNVKIGRWYHQLDKDGTPRRNAKGCYEKVATGEVATTYASLSSCPTTCPLLGYGCYSNGGMVMMTMLELNEACVSARQCALDEAKEISAFAKRGIRQRKGYRVPPMRLHTAGDCATEENARTVTRAVDEYIEAFWKQPGFSMLADPPGGKNPLPHGVDRYGLLEGAAPVWGYGHGWRDVPREAWGNMSILASCQSTAEVIEAAERGYCAVSLVVPPFSQLFGVAGPKYPCNPYQGMKVPRGRQRDVGGYTLVESVCPAQIFDHVSCTNCQLCLREPYWKKRFHENKEIRVIMLEVHGTEEEQAAEIAAGAFKE